MEVQSPDVTTAFNTYLKAVADEQLTKTTLTRDKLLFDKGAISKGQLEVAQNGETDAQADLRAAEEQLRILGVDKEHPGRHGKGLRSDQLAHCFAEYDGRGCCRTQRRGRRWFANHRGPLPCLGCLRCLRE